MDKQPSEAAVTAWARLIRVERQLMERVAVELKRAGLPPLSWYDVLLELNRASGGQLRQYEIGEEILLSKYNLSRLLDRLEAQTLISREPCVEDGRGCVVSITPEGKAMLKRMWPVYRTGIQEHFAGRLSDTDIRRLAGILAKLVK